MYMSVNVHVQYVYPDNSLSVEFIIPILSSINISHHNDYQAEWNTISS